MYLSENKNRRIIMNQVIKGLIWDIDGLLVDTEWLHFLAWNNMVKEAGGKTLSEEEYRPLVGHGWEENMKRVCRLAGISGDDNSLNKRRQMHYANLCDHGIPVIKKNIQLVRDFAVQFPQLRQMVASSSSASEVKKKVKLIDLGDIFEFALSFDDRFPNAPDKKLRKKPSPDLYNLALQKANLCGAECVAFEDSQSGVLSAKAAGIRCVALPNNLTMFLDLSAADFVIQPNESKNPVTIIARLNSI